MTLTRSGWWWSALLSVLLGGATGTVLLVFSVPVWWVVAVVLLLLAVVGWQMPYIRACLMGMPQKEVARPKRYWWWRIGAVLILVIAGVLGEAVWWVEQTTYKDLIYDGRDEKTGRIIYKEGDEYPLPLHYALKKPLWELGLAPVPDRVPVPAGSFQMGGDESDSEKPVREVTFSSGFEMGRTEVTFEQFDYYVWRMKKAGLAVNYPHDEDWGRDKRPVINVSWEDVQGYVSWLSQYTGKQCRLPSEAEWEYAARAGSTTAYPWGDDASHEYANYGKDECCEGLAEGRDQWVNTSPVASFPANKFGLRDMHGNVWEWVQDRWHDNYQNAPVDGRAREVGENSNRVLRGGSWVISSDGLRSADRYNDNPDYRNDFLGFRIVCAPPSDR